MGKRLTGISGEAMTCLQTYHWPGNVRELENVIERAAALERTPSVLAESLPASVLSKAAPARASAIIPESGFDLEEHVQQVEREFIAQALQKTGGVQVKAADLLGMSFRSFRYYMKKYNLK
jgi:two-component system response regulator PilR (NtrC family)